MRTNRKASRSTVIGSAALLLLLCGPIVHGQSRYPVHTATVGFNFLYRIWLKSDEPKFQLVANGRTGRKGDGWLVESKVPDFDIDLVFGEGLNLRTYKQGGYDLQIVSKNMPEDASDTLLAGMKEILDFYNSTFGVSDPQREVTGVFPNSIAQGRGRVFT